jgi:hypothetical protein
MQAKPPPTLWSGQGLHLPCFEASVSLKNLTLVRSSPTADDWRLPAAEIQRAK